MYSFTIVAVVFWLFVAAAAITPMIVGYKMRKSTLDTIKAAIDKGHELSPEMVRQLTGVSALPQDQRIPSVNLKIAGMIVMGTGVGAAAVATVFALVPAVAMAAPFIYAGAALTLCVGGGLYFAAKILKQHEQEQKAASPVA
ncbi:MAG TPA: hypothetical protein VG962_03495 [Steroidobacteraceae bacterium]|nr:hypothetical protein [Steroidobacteraceae bacterium]